MRSTFKAFLMCGCLLAVICGVGVWAHSVKDVRAEDAGPPTSAVRGVPSKTPLPKAHAEIYGKLSRQVQLDFKEVDIETALKSLAVSFQADIELDRTELDPEQLQRKFTVEVEQPMSIRMALQLVLQHAGLYDRQITLTNTGLRLIGVNAPADVLVLKRLDLRSASNYSTTMRRQFIDRVQHDLADHHWGEQGAWIVPAESVFAVDIHHTNAVQGQVWQLWQEEFSSNNGHLIVPQIDVSQFGKKRKPEELQKLAGELRDKYPLQSLSGRLKYEADRAAPEPPALSPAAAARLAKRDAEADEQGRLRWFNLRTRSLEQLHSEEVAKFVAREGFGISRMPQPGPSYLPLPAPPQLALPSAEVEPANPGSPVQVPAGEAESAAAGVAQLPPQNRLADFHVASEGAFLTPDRLGYVKNREHVAGFGAHAFMRMPRVEDHSPWYQEPNEQWAVRRLELISILKHENPRVYISEELPNMEELADAPTRRLSEFETGGLARLLKGEDVVTQAATNRIEMLGALRASKQCLECHEVQRGQVLGAFSYTLLRDPAVIEAAAH